MSNIESVIKKRLIELGWQAKDLIQSVGLNDQSALNKIYKRNYAKPETIEKIASALGLPLDDFAEFSNGKVLTTSPVQIKIFKNPKYKELPFVPVKARATFVRSLNSDIPIKLETFEVLIIDEEEDLEGQIVFEIDGDSMEPNYYTRMKVRAKKVDFNDWIYISNGVYIVHYAHEYLVVKRIKGNDLIEKGHLKLISDNEETGGSVLVAHKDIHNIWKIVRIVDAPPR